MNAPTVPESEVWIDTFKVRAGRTIVSVERQATSGVEGGREQDRWRVLTPKWADHIGPDRWFDDHVTAQQFAARMAELLDGQRAAWDDAMRTIRSEWATPTAAGWLAGPLDTYSCGCECHTAASEGGTRIVDGK